MNRFLRYIPCLLLMASCTSEWSDDDAPTKQGSVTITSDLMPFVGEPNSRVNVEGDGFINGDLIRLKIICPFVSGTERGETTDGNSYDAFYYLKRSGNAWTRVVSNDGFDISGTYSPSTSPDISSYYEAQQTPYVYVATTWSEERRFVAPSDAKGTLSVYDHLTPVFHADQSKEKNYRASDVLWAQTFMQTGAWNIHLGFQHKMACLDFAIDDELLPDAEYEEDGTTQKTPSQKISEDAILTLAGMPDIDQAEIVVGDYYADASKINSSYGYRQKSSCSYENNGRVIGIAVNDESLRRARIMQMTGNPSPVGGSNSSVVAEKIENTATYTAYKQAHKRYRLIVPPCTLQTKATCWLRDGSRRFRVTLDRMLFEEGKLYPVKLKLGTQPDTEPQPEPQPQPETEPSNP